MTAAIAPTNVLYIKLGQGGSWEKDCIENGLIRIGFGTQDPERFRLCQERRWDEVANSFKEEGKSKGVVVAFTNQMRSFFEDDGSNLWITFVGEKLYWGFVDDSIPPARDTDGAFRTVRDSWSWTDLDGTPLTKDKLSGALTKTAAYRQTICKVKDAGDYVVRRINGQKTPEVKRALAAAAAMKASVIELMHQLGWQDFELLVDLVFSTSGWRRIGIRGKTTKTLDLDLVLPSTGDKAFVQVKSETTSEELDKYIALIDDTLYKYMFYVFHSGEAKTDDRRVKLIGPLELADLVMNAGLVGWLIQKVS